MNIDCPEKRFLEIIENAGAEEGMFGIKDGKVVSQIHKGGMFETVFLEVEFPNNSVYIISRLPLRVEHNYERVMDLFKGLNKLDWLGGQFVIDDDNIITFHAKCVFEDLMTADNPFKIIFSGCNAFDFCQLAILKTVSGAKLLIVDDWDKTNS